MTERKEDYQKKIEEQMEREMEEIERALAAHSEITALKADDKIKEKIDQKIAATDYENIISQLPEEYQEDLRRGREARKAKEDRSKRRYVAYWKRVAAAVLVVVLVGSVGVTSVGGPKRIKELLQFDLAGREVDKVTSSTEDEQVEYTESLEEGEAYQEIKEGLGIDPVRLIKLPDKMKFQYVEVDPYMQMAYMIYEYGNQNVSYTMQCLFSDGAWATDIEDDVTDEFYVELEKATATVTEYVLPESKMTRYEARFEYQNVEYQLVATMEREEFIFLLKNLYFL